MERFSIISQKIIAIGESHAYFEGKDRINLGLQDDAASFTSRFTSHR